MTNPSSMMLPAYAGQGVSLTEVAMNDADAIVKAGLDWDVNLIEPSFPVTTALAGGDSITQHKPISKYRAVVRSDTMLPLGIVSKDFNPLQNRALFDMMRGIATDDLTWEAAGVFADGETVWALANVKDLTINIRGDISICQMLAINGHTGKRAVRIIPLTYRLRCSNQLNMVIEAQDFKRRGQNSLSDGWSVHHDSNLEANLEEAINAYRNLRVAAKDTELAWTFLANAGLTKARWARLMDIMMLKPTEGEDEAKRATRIENNRIKSETLTALLDSPTNQTDATGGTMFGALNAITEYVDHQAGRKAARFASALVGAGSRVKKEAFELATLIAGEA